MLNVEVFFNLRDSKVFETEFEKLSNEAPWKNTFIVAMPPRSGSTALVSGLAGTGLALSIWEILNPRGPFQHLLMESDAQSFHGYLDYYFRTMMKKDTLIFKTSFLDFAYFAKNKKYLIFRKPSFVLLVREDRVSQAYSLAKARQSGVWHIKKGGSTSRASIVPSLEDVRRNLALINREVEQWLLFFSRNEIVPLRATYEELVQNPFNVIEHLYHQITGGVIKKKPDLGYEVLRTESDTVIIDRYRRQLRV